MRCCPHPDRWIARAQVWLGTLVEIALPPACASDERFAAAFAAIAHVHRVMSAHDTRSDLARIARDAHRATVVVDGETYAVLRLAQALHRESGGAFDVTTPPHVGMATLRLEPAHRVWTTAPTAIDLGGIAKGHAVDCAVDALRAADARAGRVNAGGDLRVFGDDAWLPIRVRHPRDPAWTLPLFDLRDSAVATSADYFRDGRAGLTDPRARASPGFATSITVTAPTCALADALTKIVALCPRESAAMLTRHRAHAFTLAASGAAAGAGGPLTCATTWRAADPHLRLPRAAAA
jgi:thiamine biosynthesis lipoprotein